MPDKTRQELIDEIDDYCDLVAALGDSQTSIDDISRALRLRAIQMHLIRGKICLCEAIDRYEQEVTQQ